MVSVHGSADVGAPALSLPGNDCGCAQNGPLLLTVNEEMPEMIYLRSNAGGASSVISLLVERDSARHDFKLISLDEEKNLCVGIAGGKPMPGKILKLFECDKNNNSMLWRMDGRRRIRTKEQ